MARIAGVNVPENKHLEIALTHIYGVGKRTAQDICTSVKLDCSKKVSDLSEEQIETTEQPLLNILLKAIFVVQLVQILKG
jgi:small subunit ribosomal protein S13